MDLRAKFKETALSVLPVMGLVLALGLFAVPEGAGGPWWLGRFLVGGALLVVGLAVFLLGVDLGIQPMGERCGAALTAKRSLALLLGAAFVVGLVVTAAEPDIQVFGDQVRGVFPAVRKMSLTFAIAAGVGLFMSLGMLRTTLGIPLKAVLAASYAALFLLAVFAPAPFVGVAFDSGGATTGPMTVPFILALGIGVAAVRARGDRDGGFGLTGIASVGPVAAVLVYSLLNADLVPRAEPAELESHAEIATCFDSHAESAENAEFEGLFDSHAESAELGLELGFVDNGGQCELVDNPKPSAKEIEMSIRKKLRRTVVGSVDWQDADIGDVIHDLRDFSLACDPDDPSNFGGVGFSAFLGDIEDWDGKDVFRPGTYCSRAGIPPITIRATDIRLDTLLDRIEKETAFAWRIEDGRVLLSRKESWKDSSPATTANELRGDPANKEKTPPEEMHVRNAVDGVVLTSVDLRDASLPEVLGFLEASTKGAGGEDGATIPFSFDEKAWWGGVPNDDDSPRLTIRSASISLTNMLALVSDMAGVRWRIADGGIRCIPRRFEDGVSIVASPAPAPRLRTVEASDHSTPPSERGMARSAGGSTPDEERAASLPCTEYSPSLAPLGSPLSEGAGHADGPPEDIQHSASGTRHSSFFSSFSDAFPEALHESAFSILPLFGLFLVFQFALLRMTVRQTVRIAIGFAWAFVGLSIFLAGVNGGFMQAGRILGAALGAKAAGGGVGPWALLLGTGLAFGAIIVCAEPAVWVLSEQVEQASGGAIRRRTLLVFLSLGTALAIGLAMWRAVAGFPLWRLLLPGYALALLLLARTPQPFAGIAFDSGGVASGPLTSTFVLSFTLGAASGGRGGNDSFGVIALVAMMPLAAIQLMGILVERRRRRSAGRAAAPAGAAVPEPSGEDTP